MRTKRLIYCLCLAWLTGCVQIVSEQSRTETVGTNGTSSITTTTKVKGGARFAGKQALEKLAAKQTKTTQGFGIEGITQESDAGPLMGAVANGVSAAVIGAMTGRVSPAQLSQPAPAPSVPAGFKLVPVNDPSKPQPEVR